MSTPARSSNRTRFHENQWKTDPTFYPTAKLAMEAPAERYAYVAALAPDHQSRSDSVPDSPKLTSVLQIGGIVRQAPHPNNPNLRLNGGPQMVEVSRDGKRVYLTNSLYAAWDEQFYPEGIRTWLVKADAGSDGSLRFDPKFFLTSNEHRLHQVHLDGGDASSDSYCFPS
jgi:selenium-binding protein 1